MNSQLDLFSGPVIVLILSFWVFTNLSPVAVERMSLVLSVGQALESEDGVGVHTGFYTRTSLRGSIIAHRE